MNQISCVHYFMYELGDITFKTLLLKSITENIVFEILEFYFEYSAKKYSLFLCILKYSADIVLDYF